MRAPRKRRRRNHTIGFPSDANLDAVACQVSYVGSEEHKDFPSFAGQPRPRRDASLCPRTITDPVLVTKWLRSAIRIGATSAVWEGMFPRYVWHKENENYFEARLVNRGDGSYKGYPIGSDEAPRRVEEIYAQS